jgi:imidazolonepropionase-like amidohydrolase
VKGVLAAIALTGASVFTGEGALIENATVVIDGNRISAVGPSVPVPKGAQVIDVKGSIVTPGLVDAGSRLGVEEVSLEPSSVEGTRGPGGSSIRAALRVADTYNPASFVIPVARGGGITSAEVMPTQGVVSGQSIWVDLVDEKPIRQRSVALHAWVGGVGSDPGQRSRAFLSLREALEDARLYRANRGPYITRKLRVLSISALDAAALERALERELKVVIHVDRASDILTALSIVKEHRLDAILVGAAEGWQVANEIRKAGVPVLVDPLSNLPSSFNRLQARDDNAALLHAAGVELGFSVMGDARRAARLRWAAGNAVADGLPYEAALAAITKAPADMFGIVDAGRIAPGALANLVVWNGDPLEVSTWATRLFIRGQEVELRSRQDLLTERYR